jgi:hypothetical protein
MLVLCATMSTLTIIIVHTYIKQMTQNTLKGASHPNILRWKTNKSNAHVNPIVNYLILIPQILDQLWIIVKKNLKHSPMSNYKCFCLFCALKAKPFSNWHFCQWWHKTSHIPSSRTPITNKYNGWPLKLPT